MLNRVISSLTLTYLAMSLIKSVTFSFQLFDVYIWIGNPVLSRLFATLVCLYLVLICNFNIMLALERYKIISETNKRLNRRYVNTIIGIMWAEALFFVVIFASSGASDAISPDRYLHRLGWASFMTTLYFTTLVTVLTFYTKTYLFATRVLKETARAIKSNRESSLRNLQLNSQFPTTNANTVLANSANDIICAEGSSSIPSISSLNPPVPATFGRPAPSSSVNDLQNIPIQPDISTSRIIHAYSISASHLSLQRTPTSVSPQILRPSQPQTPSVVSSYNIATSHNVIYSTNISIAGSRNPFPTPTTPTPSSLQHNEQHLPQESLESLEKKSERIAMERRLLIGCVLMASSLTLFYFPYVSYFLYLALITSATTEAMVDRQDVGWVLVEFLVGIDTIATPMLILYFQRDVRISLGKMLGILDSKDDGELVGSGK
ncbi:hypothetical protein BDR26DRAFT_915250 [Obelidium mucronatum]|nr:hypothetical protein BDR26DRAFT_915250 [Obelidium mucronatum]